VIKLGHEQPTVWEGRFAEEVAECGNRGCEWWMNGWKMRNWWMWFTTGKGNGIPRVGFGGAGKRQQKSPCAC